MSTVLGQGIGKKVQLIAGASTVTAPTTVTMYTCPANTFAYFYLLRLSETGTTPMTVRHKTSGGAYTYTIASVSSATPYDAANAPTEVKMGPGDVIELVIGGAGSFGNFGYEAMALQIGQ